MHISVAIYYHIHQLLLVCVCACVSCPSMEMQVLTGTIVLCIFYVTALVQNRMHPLGSSRWLLDYSTSGETLTLTPLAYVPSLAYLWQVRPTYPANPMILLQKDSLRPGIWHSHLRCYSGHLHSKSKCLGSSSGSASASCICAPWEAAGEGVRSWIPAIHGGHQDAVPSSWLQAGLIPTVEGIWE